jgi:beta-N-acetylhexosaminidase
LSRRAVLGIAGPVLSREEREMMRDYRPKGVILFGRNIQNPTQLTDLVIQLREVLPPGGWLMVDQEGGRVARLRGPHWPDLPPAGSLKSAAAAHAHGRALGTMVREAGFDIAAAPVLDLRLSGASDVIGDRAFSDDPAVVARLGAAMAAGMMEAGITPVMKHIPGHGRAVVDSHFALPVVTEANLDDDFFPFAENCNLPCAMTAHIVYTAYDEKFPATLSRTVIETVIRGRIGFKGILISDDLAMRALTGTPAERAVAALAAGCDIALYCAGDMAGNVAILEALPDVG